MSESQVLRIVKPKRHQLIAQCRDLLKLSVDQHEPAMFRDRAGFLRRTVWDFLRTANMTKLLSQRAGPGLEPRLSFSNAFLAMCKVVSPEWLSNQLIRPSRIMHFVLGTVSYSVQLETMNDCANAALLDELQSTVDVLMDGAIGNLFLPKKAKVKSVEDLAVRCGLYHYIKLKVPEATTERKARLMRFYHAGDEDKLLAEPHMPNDLVFGWIGRDELLELLDQNMPATAGSVQYSKQLTRVSKTGNKLHLDFEDGAEDIVDAVWACDGLNSVCRKALQGNDYKPPEYTGRLAFRGRVPSAKVIAELGSEFIEEMYMFIGVEGWHILTFPIHGGNIINIVGFCVEPEYKRLGRGAKLTKEEILVYFPRRNKTADGMLQVNIHLKSLARRAFPETNVLGH